MPVVGACGAEAQAEMAVTPSMAHAHSKAVSRRMGERIVKSISLGGFGARLGLLAYVGLRRCGRWPDRTRQPRVSQMTRVAIRAVISALS